MPKKDGTTLSQHVAVLKKQGVDVSAFMPPPLPPELAPLWRWYIELCAGRPSNGMGATTLTHTEILSWSTLRKIELGSFELSCIWGLEQLFVIASKNV